MINIHGERNRDKADTKNVVVSNIVPTGNDRKQS